MSQEQRRRMRRIDRRVLEAGPDELRKIQEMDVQTQLDLVWFYDVYAERMPVPGRGKK